MKKPGVIKIDDTVMILFKNPIKNFYAESLITFLFLLGITLPLVVSIVSTDQEVSTAEMRKLAVMPELQINCLSLTSFPSKFEPYYKDHFGFRNILIKCHNYIKVFLFKKSPVSNVLLGKNDWLFITENNTIEDYRGLEKLEPLQLKAWKINYEQKQEWLAKKGIRYLFVIAPDKQSIYPEFLPDHINQVQNKSRLDQLTEYLDQNSDIQLLDLRYLFLKEKKSKMLYYSTDTHWNPEGAFLAYKEIVSNITNWFPDLKINEASFLKPVINTSNGLGISEMLNLSEFYHETVTGHPLKKKCAQEFHDIKFPRSGILSTKEELFRTKCEGASLRAIVFRDSFFTGIAPYFSENFNEVIYIWLRFDQFIVEQLIQNFKPDIVIEESVERFLFINTLAPYNLHNMAGYDFLEKNMAKEAIAEFEESKRLNPDSPDSYFNLGYAQLKNQQFKEAIANFEKAIRIYPDHEKAITILKRTKQYLQKMNHSVLNTQKEILDSPDDPNLYHNLGSLYFKAGQFQKAISSFEKALELQSDNKDTLYYLALSHGREGNYDAAISYFNKTLLAQPEQIDPYYNIACMYAKKEIPDQSIAWLQKALQKGYANWDLIKSDRDLENIRSSNGYTELLKTYNQAKK